MDGVLQFYVDDLTDADLDQVDSQRAASGSVDSIKGDNGFIYYEQQPMTQQYTSQIGKTIKSSTYTSPSSQKSNSQRSTSLPDAAALLQNRCCTQRRLAISSDPDTTPDGKAYTDTLSFFKDPFSQLTKEELQEELTSRGAVPYESVDTMSKKDLQQEMKRTLSENTTPKDRNWTRNGLVPIIEAVYRYYGYDPNVHIEAATVKDTPNTATGADPDILEEGLSRPVAPAD
ncbi:Hypp5314 [Branchiostoma lanceolatum]|uniref:Hypp5314 protein n=1 Tax=Branchiostoma lanceolatum TaxID=7740 RepID=A0A8K0EZ85_BRALA|nr:Hypp5314 [Branchiostoma lanceolatum]